MKFQSQAAAGVPGTLAPSPAGLKVSPRFCKVTLEKVHDEGAPSRGGCWGGRAWWAPPCQEREGELFKEENAGSVQPPPATTAPGSARGSAVPPSSTGQGWEWEPNLGGSHKAAGHSEVVSGRPEQRSHLAPAPGFPASRATLPLRPGGGAPPQVWKRALRAGPPPLPSSGFGTPGVTAQVSEGLTLPEPEEGPLGLHPAPPPLLCVFGFFSSRSVCGVILGAVSEEVL